jgi:hypothetical protein
VFVVPTQHEFQFKTAPIFRIFTTSILPIFTTSIFQSLPQTACGFAMESPRSFELESLFAGVFDDSA